ncbi:MAG: hypothetical protein J6S21_04550, partial [Victivallales bacterium]|nr:hypothetical protein [Victivallales bacterium]
DWFNGRRTPDANPYLQGAIIGLNLGTTAPAIYRALVEGACCGARRIIERFRDNNIPVGSIIATGGISRKSPFVMQMCADLLNIPVKVAASDQVCALGSAMFGAVAAGIHPDTQSAMKAMNSGFDMVYNPIPENVPVYEKIYRRYLRYANAVEKEQLQDA